MEHVVIAHAAHEILHDQPDAFIHTVRAFLNSATKMATCYLGYC